MVTFELSDGVAVVRLDRPEGMNALSHAILDELYETFVRVGREPGVRASILAGAWAESYELSALDEDSARLAAQRGRQVCERIERCPVPVIAAVDGAAAGVGCDLALRCHLRIASTRAQFSLSETRPGRPPAYCDIERLAGRIGRERASAVMSASGSLSAEEAHRAGLVCRITSLEQLLAEAESLARTIAGLAPLAIRACLEAVTRGTELSLEEGLVLEAELFSRLFSTEDMREGTRAFLEKRAPVFQGK